MQSPRDLHKKSKKRRRIDSYRSSDMGEDHQTLPQADTYRPSDSGPSRGIDSYRPPERNFAGVPDVHRSTSSSTSRTVNGSRPSPSGIKQPSPRGPRPSWADLNPSKKSPVKWTESTPSKSDSFDYSRVPRGPAADMGNVSSAQPSRNALTSPHVYITLREVNRPYPIFFQPEWVPHMEKLLKNKGIRHITKLQSDPHGCYVFFEDHASAQADTCALRCAKSRLFSAYAMDIKAVKSGTKAQPLASLPAQSKMRDSSEVHSPTNPALSTPQRPKDDPAGNKVAIDDAGTILTVQTEPQQSVPTGVSGEPKPVASVQLQAASKPVASTESAKRSSVESNQGSTSAATPGPIGRNHSVPQSHGLIRNRSPAFDRQARNGISFLRADDEISQVSGFAPSEVSSVGSKIDLTQCAACKKGANGINPFVQCSACRRNYHETCGKSPINLLERSKWRCLRCIKRQRRAPVSSEQGNPGGHPPSANTPPSLPTVCQTGTDLHPESEPARSKSPLCDNTQNPQPLGDVKPLIAKSPSPLNEQPPPDCFVTSFGSEFMSVSDSVLSSTLLSDGLRSDDHRPPPAGVITDRRDAPVAQELQNEAVPDRRPLQLSSSGSAARMEAQPEQLSVPMDTSLPGNALPAFRIVCNTCSNPISAKNPSCAQCQITQSQPGQDQALHLIKAGLPVTTGRVNVSTSSSSLSPYDEDSSSLSSLSPESPPATGPNSATTPALREELFVEQNSTSRSTFPPEYLPTTSAARVLSHSRSNPGENGQLAAATQTGRPPSIFKYKELIALALRRGGRKNAYETWMWVVQNIPNMRADDKKLQAGLSSALAKHPEFVKEEMPGKLRCVYSLRGDYDKSLIDVNKIERLYALHGIHATSAREIEPSGRHAAPHATMTNNQTARNNCRRTLKMPKASQQPPRLSPPRAPQNLTQPVPALKASQILPASSLKARKSATAFPLAPSSRLDGEHGHAHRITPALPTPSRGQSSTSGINGTVPSKTDTGMRKSSKKRKFSDFVSTEVAEALRLTTHAPSANINGYRTPKFDDPDEATQADVEALFSISNKLPHVDPFVDPSRAPAKGRKGTSRPVESGNGSRPTVKDLFAECPWEDPHWPGNAGFDREAKIAEIKRRPPRKHPIKPPSTTTDTPRNVRYPANPLIQNQRGYFKWMEQRAKEFGAGYAVRPENETTNETSTYTSKANSILVFGTLEAALELPRIPIFSMDKHGYVEVRDASGFHNIQRVWKTTLGHFDEE